MEKRDEFFSRLTKCTTGERAVLRRNCGKMLRDADGQAVEAFYRNLPFDVPVWQEDLWFAAACFSCLWNDGEEPAALEDIFRGMKESSDSMEHRLAILLDMRWDEDGFLLSKLCRIVKMAKSKGYVVDCGKLLEDLIYWNSPHQSVQKKWARAMYMKHCDQSQEV